MAATAASQRSKVRNVFGEATKEKYMGVRVNNKSVEGSGLSASLSYIAFPWDVNGGIVTAISTAAIANRSPTLVHFKGHKGVIQDICFSPFYDTLFATASDDATVKIWEIPNIVTATTTRQDSLATLTGHERKVLICAFNPVADWVLASGSQDSTVRVWDAEVQKALYWVRIPDAIQHLKWNYNGSLLASTSKDKYLRIIDPRKNKIIAETQAHEGIKGSKVEWLGGNIAPSNYLFTTGFEKGPGREFALWDARQLDKPVQKGTLHRGAGTLFPYWDGDSGLLLLPGRGDGCIRMMEVHEGSVHFNSDYRFSESARGFGVAPKRAMDVTKCEIQRCYIIDSPSTLQPIQFIVPRKAQEFQSDLFPPCVSGEPAMGAPDWSEGKDVAEPLRCPMVPKPDGAPMFTPLKLMSSVAAQRKDFRVSNSSAVLQRQLTKADGKLQELDKEVLRQTQETEAIREENRKLKSDIEELERKLVDCTETLQRVEKDNASLQRKNEELEDLFGVCRKAMLAVATANAEQAET